jgi:hypothetical protein
MMAPAFVAVVMSLANAKEPTGDESHINRVRIDQYITNRKNTEPEVISPCFGLLKHSVMVYHA